MSVDVANETSTPSTPKTPREQVIEKYNTLYGQTPTPTGEGTAEPTVEPVVEPTVGGESGEVQAPSTPAQPQEQTPQLPPEVLAALQSIAGMQEELKTLRQTQPTTQVEKPQAAAVVETPQNVKTQWVELLKEGKFEEATDQISQYIEGKVLSKVAQDLAPSTINQSIEAIKYEQQITQDIQEVRTQLPTLIPNVDPSDLEAFIAPALEKALVLAEETQKPKNLNERRAIFKKALNEQVEFARKLFQKQRAAGSEAARTTHQQVLSSSPIPPQSVATPQPTQKEAPTGSDYLKARIQRMNEMRGLGGPKSV